MTFLDLCAGIGGFSLGLERAGLSWAGQVEIDDYCNRILARHWPHVPRWGDITALDRATLPAVDLVCGGYPCQPFSLAGKREGAGDDRHLWPTIREIVAHIPWVCHRDAKRVLSYSGAWERALQDAGLQHFPMYHIRHGAATEMLAAGADPASVAAQLGHSTVTTTCSVYAHVTVGGQKRAAALMPSIDAE